MLLVGAVLLAVCGLAAGSECPTPNVRTVLFKQSDYDKPCWSREEIALLFSRRMMQELVPRRKPQAVALLLAYLRDCLETVRSAAGSRRTHSLALAALADTLGGYLQAFGLPMAREAYYEGGLSYGVTRQLHDLQSAFKKLLHTDGGGWTRPVVVRRSTHIQPLSSLTRVDKTESCRLLIDKNDINGFKAKYNEVDVLLPFLDDVHNPSAIALPFRDRNLYNIRSRSSQNIITRYYSRVIQCLAYTYGATSVPDSGPSISVPVQNFINGFGDWLSAYVIPRLHDSEWYPGFGGVWRVLETLQLKGYKMPEIENSKTGCKTEDTVQLDSPTTAVDVVEETSKRFFIIVIASVVIAFWLIVLLVFILYRWLATKRAHCRFEQSYPGTTCDDTSFCDESPTTTTDTTESSRSRQKKKKKKKKKLKRRKSSMTREVEIGENDFDDLEDCDDFGKNLEAGLSECLKCACSRGLKQGCQCDSKAKKRSRSFSRKRRRSQPTDSSECSRDSSLDRQICFEK